MEEQDEPSVLDIFAGLALIGVVASSQGMGTAENIAKDAYNIAEAMVEERKKRNTCTQE